MRILILIALMLCMPIAACAEQKKPDVGSTANAQSVYQLSIDAHCETDADCAVKNVGNCCGYYPGCVNKNSEPDLKALEQSCQEQQMMSICGFPDISGCSCVSGLCQPSNAGGTSVAQ